VFLKRASAQNKGLYVNNVILSHNHNLSTMVFSVFLSTEPHPAWRKVHALRTKYFVRETSVEKRTEDSDESRINRSASGRRTRTQFFHPFFRPRFLATIGIFFFGIFLCGQAS
jgi:hypothetical protein